MTDTNAKGGRANATLTSDQLVTKREAAELTGKHPDTIKDRLAAGAYPNAIQVGGRGTWMIPVKDLVAAGDLDAARVSEVPVLLESLRESKQVSELRAEIAELRTALEVATALAEERKGNIDMLNTLLLAVAPSLGGSSSGTQAVA